MPSLVVKSSSTVMFTNLHLRVCSVGVDKKLILSQHACTRVRLCFPFLPPDWLVDRGPLVSAGAEAFVLCCCTLVNRGSLAFAVSGTSLLCCCALVDRSPLVWAVSRLSLLCCRVSPACLVNRSSLGFGVSVVACWHAALLACTLTPCLGEFPFFSVAPVAPPGPPAPLLLLCEAFGGAPPGGG